MKADDVRVVAVLGAGVMGHGIAEVAAISGYDVRLYDVEERFLKSGLDGIGWSLSKFVEKRSITRDKAEETMGRIRGTLVLREAVSDADVVIEAVPEDLETKRRLFAEVDALAPPGALFASNTSTLPIGELAAATKRRGLFVGMHFFNPPPMMPLLEVTKGDGTSDESVALAVGLGRRLGKDVVVCRKDVPGFVVNRVLGPLLNEAAWVVQRGEATQEQVDSMALYTVGLPMGLFELADYSGIDTIYKAGVAVASRDQSNVLVAPLFKQKAEEGKLGRKTGEGFYKYKAGGWTRPAIAREAGKGIDPLTVFAPAVNASAWLLRNEVCSAEELDRAVKLGLGFPEGILRLADAWGVDKAVGVLNAKAGSWGGFYSPDPLLLKMVAAGSTGKSARRGFYEYAAAATGPAEVVVRKEPPLAWVVLNRPHRLNTITHVLVKELVEALRSLDEDASVRVIVIRGEGDKAFSAGADLTSFESVAPGRVFAFARGWFESFSVVEKVGKPVVAALNGLAFGGGCELALACDFRLASEDAQIGLTETKLGLMPGAGGTQRLSRIVGEPKAKEMIFLAERLTAEEALRVGLVNRVFRKAEFEKGVTDFALRLAKQPPLSMKLAKHAMNLSSQVPTEAGQLFEAAGFGLLLSTEDANEGISAFLEKREPEFKGE